MGRWRVSDARTICGMRLTDWDQQRLLIFSAAELARRHLAAGLRLSAPEAIAVICDAMFDAARAGASYLEVEAAGRAALTADQVMDGVPTLVDEIRLEVVFDDGTRLVVLRQPLGDSSNEDPVDQSESPATHARPSIQLSVTNTGTRAIRVSSHFPFHRVNARLEFDRQAAAGYRLDLPSGATVRWSPGETREVRLIRFGGAGSPASSGA